MTIAVIGGGFFGVTTALTLDRNGYSVTLYEQADDILTAASWGNQWRLHLGYHYPRSKSTARQCNDSAPQFADEFPEAVITDTDHYYCIADDDQTKTTADEYLAFCDDLGLDYHESIPPTVNPDSVALGVQVPENRIDPHALKAACWSRLLNSDVTLRFGTRITDLDSLDHDYKIVATYAGMNDLFDDWSSLADRYKYQLVEKPLLHLPSTFAETSVVVMDGPYMCYDPYGKTGHVLLSNVVHSIHKSSVGDQSAIGEDYRALLNNGLIRNPPITNLDQFIDATEPFMPEITEYDHLGSFFTIRTVLAGVEDTDERPTIVEQDDDTFKLFSGKLASAVPAAYDILDRLDS